MENKSFESVFRAHCQLKNISTDIPLPVELLSEIFGHIDSKDYSKLALVCHFWYKLIQGLLIGEQRMYKGSFPLHHHYLIEHEKPNLPLQFIWPTLFTLSNELLKNRQQQLLDLLIKEGETNNLTKFCRFILEELKRNNTPIDVFKTHLSVFFNENNMHWSEIFLDLHQNIDANKMRILSLLFTIIQDYQQQNIADAIFALFNETCDQSDPLWWSATLLCRQEFEAPDSLDLKNKLLFFCVLCNDARAIPTLVQGDAELSQKQCNPYNNSPTERPLPFLATALKNDDALIHLMQTNLTHPQTENWLDGALHRAVNDGNLLLCIILCTKVNLDVLDERGENALRIALRKKDEKIARVLMSAGSVTPIQQEYIKSLILFSTLLIFMALSYTLVLVSLASIFGCLTGAGFLIQCAPWIQTTLSLGLLFIGTLNCLCSGYFAEPFWQTTKESKEAYQLWQKLKGQKSQVSLEEHDLASTTEAKEAIPDIIITPPPAVIDNIVVSPVSPSTYVKLENTIVSPSTTLKEILIEDSCIEKDDPSFRPMFYKPPTADVVGEKPSLPASAEENNSQQEGRIENSEDTLRTMMTGGS